MHNNIKRKMLKPTIFLLVIFQLIYSQEINVHEKYLDESRRFYEYKIKEASKKDLRFFRNEIFARHGYSFKSKDLLDFFKKQSWYKADSSIDFKQIKLTKREEEVLSLIQYYEQNYDFMKLVNLSEEIYDLPNIANNKDSVDYELSRYDFDIAGIGVHDYISSAKSKFGKELFTHKSKTIYDMDVPDDEVKMWLEDYVFDDVVVYTLDGQILSIHCLNTKYSTVRDLKIGTTIDDIERKFPGLKIKRNIEGKIEFGIPFFLWMMIKIDDNKISQILVRDPNN